jgi:hypothetical protein
MLNHARRWRDSYCSCRSSEVMMLLSVFRVCIQYVSSTSVEISLPLGGFPRHEFQSLRNSEKAAEPGAGGSAGWAALAAVACALCLTLVLKVVLIGCQQRGIHTCRLNLDVSQCIQRAEMWESDRPLLICASSPTASRARWLSRA